MRVAEKIALVTGAASGLGAQIAIQLFQEGAKVILTDIDTAAGSSLAERINGVFLPLDVANLSEWQSIVERIMSQFGRIDVLVHCAGIGGDLQQVGLDTSEKNWNKVISVNLTGSFFACKTVVPEMLKAKQGSVILMSSVAAFLGTPSLLAYGVSKSGVAHLARSMALIGAKGGARVRCNSIHPGIIKTKMLETTLSEFARQAGSPVADIESAMCGAVPFGEVGEPIDVANMVVFLASDESSYVTGSEFKVDGGWSIRDERP